jgi:hypothetical protein
MGKRIWEKEFYSTAFTDSHRFSIWTATRFGPHSIVRQIGVLEIGLRQSKPPLLLSSNEEFVAWASEVQLGKVHS